MVLRVHPKTVFDLVGVAVDVDPIELRSRRVIDGGHDAFVG